MDNSLKTALELKAIKSAEGNFEDLVIGCLLTNTELCMSTAVRFGVNEKWFESLRAMESFIAIRNLWSQGKPCDDAIIAKEIGDDEGYLRFCKHSFPQIHNFESYLEYVRENYTRRELSMIMMDVLDRSSDETYSSADLVSMVLDRSSKIIIPVEEEKSNDDVIAEIIWENQNPEAKAGLIWPTESMNKLLQKITNEYIFVMAPPSVGKTAFMLQMSDMMGERVDYIALESNQKDLLSRVMARRLEKNMRRFLSPHAIEAAEELKGTTNNLVLTSEPNTIEKIRAYAKWAKTQGSRMVIIDNLKHIRGGDAESKVEKYSNFSMDLKHIRDDVGLPVAVVHHANNDGSTRHCKDIDADADISIKILPSDKDGDCVQACKENNWESKDTVFVNIEKNRDGFTPMFKFDFKKNIQTFIEVES